MTMYYGEVRFPFRNTKSLKISLRLIYSSNRDVRLIPEYLRIEINSVIQTILFRKTPSAMRLR